MTHNDFILPFRNAAWSTLVPIGGECKGPPFRFPERLPVAVKCAIHSWMKAWLVIVDHPFAAVTDEDGRFEITGLPVGEHDFVFWHERTGYIDRPQIGIGRGTNDLKEIPVDGPRL